MARLLGSVWEMAGTVSSGSAGSGSNLGNADNSRSIERKNRSSGGVIKEGSDEKA